MRRLTFLFLILLGAARLCGEESTLADSVAGFTNEQGKLGWSYLFYISSKDGTGTYVPDDAQPMKWTVSSKDAREAWSGPFPYFFLDREHAKSRAIDGGYQGWAVRRWTSSLDGDVVITGSVKCTSKTDSGGETGDGIGLRIFLDQKEIFTKLLAPQESVDLKIQTPVRQGSKVDFAITPGPGLNALFDGAEFHAVIRKAP